MKQIKDILKHGKKKAFTPTGAEDDKLFKASNMKYAQADDPHGHKRPQDTKAYQAAQKHSRVGVVTDGGKEVDPFNPPSPKNAVFEKVDHAQKYSKTVNDMTVSKFHVSKDGKRVGTIKHVSKGADHEKIAFFPLGARKAKAFNAKSIPGGSQRDKIAHMIKMHVKEDVSLEDIVEKYKVGERLTARDPSGYAKRIPKMKKLKPKIPNQ